MEEASINRTRRCLRADTRATIYAYGCNGHQRIALAFNLLLCFGIAFLWFVGTVHERLTYLEDRFISISFYGAALLYLA
jgi:hypothetical protein